MRNAFIDTLVDVADADDRVWLVCGDLGYSVLEKFITRFPKRFVNAGVAEQNMTGLAAGLALAGKTVFVYSIVNFPVMRCLEQVRNDVCYHRLNVKIVAVGGGLVYGGHGYTHHGSEDLAVMRVLPNMTVIAPGDPVETKLATAAVARHVGPVYLRLGRGGEPAVHQIPPLFRIGDAIPVRRGNDAAILSTGGTLPLAKTAAETLAAEGIQSQVWSIPTLTPIDARALDAAASTRAVVTVEEHGLGGLGTIAAEWFAANRPTRLRTVQLSREPVECAGSHDFLRSWHGVSAPGVAAAVRDLIKAKT